MIKYIGSKRVLVPHIVRAMSGFPESGRVLDLFSGTSRVARGLKETGRYVIANDHLAYAATLGRCYVQADADRWLYEATLESSVWQATVGKRVMGLAVTDEVGTFGAQLNG